MRRSSSGKGKADVLELCRKATAKELGGPSQQHNEAILAYIRGGKVYLGDAADILVGRLQQKRPWKVFLALIVIQRILDQCGALLDQRQQEQILNEVARVAHKPMDRFSHDLRAEQDSKTLAFEILGHTQGQHSAPDRQHEAATTPAALPCAAAANPGHEQQARRPEHEVQALLLRARSQMELVQEAVLPLTDSDAPPMGDADARFLNSAVAALRAYQSDLEAAVAQLASEGTQASASLMSLCLKTLDGLSATLDLFTEVTAAREGDAAAVGKAPLPGNISYPTTPAHISYPTTPAQTDARCASAQQHAPNLLPGFEYAAAPSQLGGRAPAAAAGTGDKDLLHELGWV